MLESINNMLTSELSSTRMVPISLGMIYDEQNYESVSIIYDTMMNVCGDANIVALFLGNEFFGYGVYHERDYVSVTVTIPHYDTGHKHTILFEYDSDTESDIYQTYELNEIVSIFELVEL